MKYLLQAIESCRHRVDLSDADLTKLLTDVQKSRDDRTLLHDSLERLLYDLRAQSHAQAFLARVNKRDAPDYYDVVKNPMDLGLMLKMVKSGKYRSKEAFRKDLDLIWDNCLLYNNEPTHPLRLSANLMRKRSHDLLSYIQDSHDVKSALSEWVATHTSLTPAEAKALQRGDTAGVAGITHSTSASYFGAVAAVTASPPASQAPGPSSHSPLAAAKDTTPTTYRAVLMPLVNTLPFEEQPAFRLGSAASLGQAEVEERQRDERNSSLLVHCLGRDWTSVYPSETSKGKRREVVGDQQPIDEIGDDTAEVQKIVRNLAKGNALALSLYGAGGTSREAACPQTMDRIECAALPKLHCSYRIPVEAAYLKLDSEGQSWQDLERQIRSDEIESHELRTEGGFSSMEVTSPLPKARRKPRERRRGVDCMKRNIKTHGRMYRLKRKFDLLDYCLDNEHPLPSSLLLDSDEEGVENVGDAIGRKYQEIKPGQAIWLSRTHRDVKPSQHGHSLHSRTPAALLEGETGCSVPAHPFPHLSHVAARSALHSRISLLCGNAGFSSSHSRPLDILTSVLEEFICSMGRSLRLYLDRYASTTMSPEEILLHTLHATSSVGPNELEKYIFEDTVRYSNRLEDLRRKMEYSWKERIAIGEERLVSEEDARFFGAEGSEDLMVGNIPSALDDDFFGFKALGLDRELGMNDLTIPARLFRGRGGIPGRRAGEIAGTGKDKEGDKEKYPPPPPYIRLSACAVPAQIGLLRYFYRDLLHRRGHRVRRAKPQQHGRNRQGSADADDEDEEEGGSEGSLTISDDEVDRAGTSTGIACTGTRGSGGAGGGGQGAGMKVGQAGIMPKRDFWVDPVVLARTKNRTAGGKSSNAAGGATQVVPVPSASASSAPAASLGKSGAGATIGKKTGAGGSTTSKKARSKKDR